MELENEQQIIDKAKVDTAAFEPLYNLYYERILRFVYKRMEELEDSRDVTSMVFIKALSNIGKYQHQGLPFSSWLYRIAVNEVNLYYRRNKKARVISLDDNSLKTIANEAEGFTKEDMALLKKALLHLKEDELQIIQLRYFEERPFSQVAQILEITENNAKVKTYRVLDKLKRVFTQLA